MRLLILLFPLLLLADSTILKKIDERLQPFAYESYRKLINIEPDGTKKEFVMYMLKKDKDKVISYFLSPASDKGRTTLRLGDNMWLYIPGIAKPLRIASMQSVTGGVFNNADIMRLDFHVEYDVAKQTEQGGELILDLTAKNETVTYEKLVMTVDKKSLFPKVIDCYAGGIRLKSIRYLDTKDFGDGVKRPSVLETTSDLQKGYKSVMIFGKIKKRKLDDAVFTIDNIAKVGELRE